MTGSEVPEGIALDRVVATSALSARAAYGWTALTLVLSALLQLAVYRKGGHTALGDIPGRFFAWHLGPHTFPYLDVPVEYPVVIGYLAYLVSLVARSGSSFFGLTAVMNAGLVFVMTGLLRTRGGPRVWRWVLGVPVVLYAFHNWDIYAMVPAVLGIIAFEAGSDLGAGAWLGLGFSTKLFPGLLVPPLAAQRWCAGDRRGAARLIVGAVVVTLALNLPVAMASLHGWSDPARFQGARHATWGSLISWLTTPPWVGGQWLADPARVANVIAAVSLAVGLVVLAVFAVRRNLSAAAVGAAVVGVFLLTNKVYSPNYDFWLVPFFVLLPLSRRLWVAFCAADLAMFVVVLGRFHGLVDPDVARTLVPFVVAVRAVVIVGVIVFALRAQTERGRERWRRVGPVGLSAHRE